ncbi:MAG: hypothetical protein LBE20_03625, partial [Deltaproteobacteria bacterium]|nr:hypothetical protein [Deltaproteobacteria bacterium]
MNNDNENYDIKAFTALEIVQEELQNEKDRRKEERLGWGLVCIICFNGAIFPNVNLGATTFLFIL